MPSTLTAVLLPVLLSAVLAGPAAPQGDALTAELHALIDEAVARPESVGMSVGVMHRDEWLVAGGFGIAELEHGAPADEDTLFRIGSITKQFTAAAVMRLVERGELDLEADFRTYLPDYPDPGATITVRHLLTHTSGIPSYTGLASWRPTFPLEVSHDQLLAHFERLELEFPPGTSFAYNNSGYYLLGVLIEAVTGETYAENIAALIAPLDLTRTRYGSNRDLIRNRAQGYRMVDGELANDALIGMSQPGGAGGLLSTARELVLWARALARGEVVSEASYRQMTTPFTLAGGSDTGYGFGLRITRDEDVLRIAHGGGIHGFNAHLLHLPEQAVTVAVISNSEAWRAAPLAGRLARRILSEPAGATAPPAVDLGEPTPLGSLPVLHRLPRAWTPESPASSMRLAQYRIGPDPDPLCIVYWFGSGGGGGRDANLERWQGQFAAGAEAVTEDLPIGDGLAATLLDVRGTYVAEVRPGAGTRLREPGWRMLAAYVEVPEGPLYIKLVGPAAEVASERDAFAAWLRSFRRR